MDLEDWCKGGDGEGKSMVGELMSAILHDHELTLIYNRAFE